ncbi:MAG: hypothetical protein LBV00_07525 [Propionibacteriaceae bacterium]|jgi:tight adherence protein B|nr:hypothetical protein [Propionibacteriaceae bacterium]
MMVLAVVAAMAAAWLSVAGPTSGGRRLMVVSPRRRRPHNQWRVLVGACLLACGVGVVVPMVALIAAVGMVAATAAWIIVARMRQRNMLRRLRQVVRAAQVTESLLALGHIPVVALTLASQECPVLEPVVAAVRMGGEPWEVLDQLAREPGQAGLAGIGQGWRIAQITGASMHESLTRVRKDLEDGADLAVVVAGELAGPKMTGQLLAVLPLAGLVMAGFLGVDPLQFFTDGLVGRCCLILGVGLVCLGVVWTELLVGRAQIMRPGRAAS